jgi:hypothetical protein
MSIVGLEPTLLSETNFKSVVSTNFTKCLSKAIHNNIKYEIKKNNVNIKKIKIINK